MKKLFNKNLTPNIWKKIEIKLGGHVILDNIIIKKYLDQFWNDIMNKLDQDQIVLFLFRVKLGDENDPKFISDYLTIGRLYQINNSSNDFNKLYDVYNGLLNDKEEITFINVPLHRIAFSYKIIAKDNNKIISNTKQIMKTYPIRGYNLPNTMNLKLWGSTLTIPQLTVEKNNELILIRKKGSKFLYEIEITQDSNELIYNVKLILPNNEVMLTFKDIKNIKDPINNFIRYIGRSEYYFIDGILELKINPWRTSYLEGVKELLNFLSSKLAINNSAFILIPNWKDSSFYKLLVQKYLFLFNTSTIPLIEYKLFILISDFKDSLFFSLLVQKYPFLFYFNTFPLIEAPTISKNKNYIRKSRGKNVQLIETYTKSKHRSYILTFKNTPLFTSVYKGMMKFFKGNFKWNNKTILAQTVINGQTYSLHKNVVINNKTTHKEYWNLIEDSIQQNYTKDYLIEVYPIIKLVIYNLDDKRNKNIAIHINNSNLSLQERWESIKKKYPFINKRTFSTYITPLKKDKVMKPFLIFNKELLTDLSSIIVKVIFVHDLDNSIFKFIHNYLLNHFDHNLIEVIQDKNNNYIYIRIFSIKFINSHRIFPITELELIDLFKGKNLYDALVNAQSIYFKKFNIDITSIVSTGSLAFKLFRINFLMKYNSIPILSKQLDSIVRNSYFGGGVHVFKLNKIIKNVYHFDINSLYPFAMLKAMPFKHLKTFIPNNNHWRLNDKFFGFCKVEVTISNKCNKILLPHRIDSNITYEPGTFTGVYFSEELKLYLKNPNYKFKYLECYEFSNFYPFKEYVNTFYKIKSTSLGVDKAIAKLLLNNLYGFFGRSYQLLKTVKINNDDIISFLKEFDSTIINIDELNDYSLIKYVDTNDNYQIKSNVAIASAITSYARIIMHPYLLLSSVIYSDTDSIFTIKPLDPKLISKEIGKFKDEMDGIIIKQFICKGPKRYAYWFIDNNQRIERSVHAGLERNSIKFNKFLSQR